MAKRQKMTLAEAIHMCGPCIAAGCVLPRNHSGVCSETDTGAEWVFVLGGVRAVVAKADLADAMPVAMRLHSDLVARIDAAAKRTGISRSNAIRAALEQHDWDGRM